QTLRRVPGAPSPATSPAPTASSRTPTRAARQQGSAFTGSVCSSHKRDTMDRRGFTLIELLVVISIVGVLAAMLMPELQQARAAARAAACASNLRELGLATQMYLDDYGVYFPYYTTVAAGRLWYFGLESPYNPNGGPGTRNIDLTQAKLYPYLQTKQRIQVCPSYNYNSSL